MGNGCSMPTLASEVSVEGVAPRSAKLCSGAVVPDVIVMLAISFVRGRHVGRAARAVAAEWAGSGSVRAACSQAAVTMPRAVDRQVPAIVPATVQPSLRPVLIAWHFRVDRHR